MSLPDASARDGRVRVLYLIARMNVGGPASQVLALAAGLDPAEFEVRILVGSVGPGEADYLDLRQEGADVVRVPGLGRDIDPLGDVRALWNIVREMRRFRPDVVHTHTAKAGVLGRVAAWLTGVPHTVHTFHGHLLQGYFSGSVTRVIIGIERVLAMRTSRLVTVGERVRDELLAVGIGVPERYVPMPPGVARITPPGRREARELLGLPLDAIVVAFVGRLTAVKRPDRFVEVVGRVAKARDDVVFVVVGDGPATEDTRRLARPLGDAVRFLGWRSDVEQVYAASDLVLLTSDNEGMPVSLIEAAWCGVPAVTTDVGSAAEVVIDGRTGYVRPTDVEALSEAVLRLAASPELRRMLGHNAVEAAAANFSIDRLVRRSGDLYITLMSA